MSKSYRTMNLTELRYEIERVEVLLLSNKHPHTQKQNRKYLQNLYKEYDKKVEEIW